MDKKLTTIKVTIDTRQKLKILVAKKRMKGYDELLNWFIEKSGVKL